MLTSLVLSVALSAAAVPPGAFVEEHAPPGQEGAQPTIRRFERRADEMDRRLAWEAYNNELTQLWNDYREAGSTPKAWREYNRAAAQAKRRYVIADPFYAPVTE
jgi:hypothetical protein